MNDEFNPILAPLSDHDIAMRDIARVPLHFESNRTRKRRERREADEARASAPPTPCEALRLRVGGLSRLRALPNDYRDELEDILHDILNLLGER